MLAELVSIQLSTHFLLLLSVTDIPALNHTAFELTMQITANIEIDAKRKKKELQSSAFDIASNFATSLHNSK